MMDDQGLKGELETKYLYNELIKYMDERPELKT